MKSKTRLTQGGGSKTQNGRFPSKIAVHLKKVCSKISLCEYSGCCKRAVASHLLVGVLITLLGVLKIKHIKCSGVPPVYPPDTSLTSAFNGQVENLTPNFLPLTILAGGLRVHLTEC